MSHFLQELSQQLQGVSDGVYRCVSARLVIYRERLGLLVHGVRMVPKAPKVALALMEIPVLLVLLERR